MFWLIFGLAKLQHFTMNGKLFLFIYQYFSTNDDKTKLTTDPLFRESINVNNFILVTSITYLTTSQKISLTN